ncbi:DUF2950 domain-containing protein [Geotalea uraniireducens]|uniref:DUF2950 domain-containing protein n=1 Tax=Geotalea uraniireducens (strain Rf4) TaxID=351605 RepID=A5G4X2_GEOUR|nr:DUF2950 domain-containing protein [Geotalea uraniireducens]ABQ26840.1 hypothetical protein Gura_2666 [Geotalea uraniireducens Rf4]
MTVMKYCKDNLSRCLLILSAMLLILVLGVSALAASAGNKQKSFASPEKAVHNLIAALKGNDDKGLATVLGPGSQSLISSGDRVADRAGRAEFVRLYEEKNRIELEKPDKAVLSIGNQDYPVPIPVVKRGNAWLFDTRAGKEEILSRRIGRNELKAIDVAHAYVDAQREYAFNERGGVEVLEFAQKFLSTPGKQDGLYWKTQEGEEESPLGPLIAQAAREGYTKGKDDKPVPFHGYYFRILKAQESNADGGAFNYVVNGHMILGFALVAYPAQYGASGIMTFIVNHDGVVYQKNLGRNSAKVAAAMKLYDPDKSWRKVE